MLIETGNKQLEGLRNVGRLSAKECGARRVNHRRTTRCQSDAQGACRGASLARFHMCGRHLHCGLASLERALQLTGYTCEFQHTEQKTYKDLR